MEQYTINKEHLEAVMYGYASHIAAYDTKAISALEWFKKYGPRTPSPAKAEQELRPIKPLGDWLLAQTDLPPRMLPDGGYWYYGSVLQLLKRYLKEHELTTPPAKEAGQPELPDTVHDRIIAHQKDGMSLEQAIYRTGYDDGQQPAPSGLRWVKASERLPEKDGYVCIKINGGYCGGFVTTRGNGIRRIESSGSYVMTGWKNAEWLDESDSPAPVQVDPLSFHKWIKKEGWEPHSSGDYWYKLDYPSQWPTSHTCLEHELITLYTQSLQNKQL